MRILISLYFFYVPAPKKWQIKEKPSSLFRAQTQLHHQGQTSQLSQGAPDTPAPGGT